LRRLLQSGYLEECVGVSHGAHHTPYTHQSKAPLVSATSALGTQHPLVQPKTEAQDQQQLSRRSLAGTKMYIVDMLQLLRDMDASSMSVAVHSSQGEMEFIQNVTAAARLIAEKCGPSYGLRVVYKLREIVPEVHLSLLQALAFEIEADGAKLS